MDEGASVASRWSLLAKEKSAEQKKICAHLAHFKSKYFLSIAEWIVDWGGFSKLFWFGHRIVAVFRRLI